MGKHFTCEGFARGWFVAAFSDEIAAGETKPLRYFGKDLVLFRTESGEPKMLDAYCPHMGFHLGHGGEVEGEGIRCPFHSWKWSGEGECVDIPYANKIPPKAKMACWPVHESHGIIFVWHDPDKAAPTWEMPEVEAYATGDWTAWNHELIEVKTHPHAIVENVADTGHFIPVHQTHVESFEAIFDGHTATQVNSGVAYPLGGGEDNYQLRATYFGPGYQLTDIEGVLHAKLVNAHTPIDENLLVLRFGVMLKKGNDPRQTEQFSNQYIKNLRNGFFQDVRIWENKVFIERPILCDGDGPIMKLRKWYRQFYQPAH